MNGKMVGRPMEILLVEDSLTQANVTFHALQKADFEHRLSIVLDGQEALDFLGKVGKYARVPNPDLILLDLRLPKVDGIDVLVEIKRTETLRNAAVVVMTASDDEEDRAHCLHSNVDAYLTKPVDVRKFLDVVRQLRDFWKHEELILPAAV